MSIEYVFDIVRKKVLNGGYTNVRGTQGLFHQKGKTMTLYMKVDKTPERLPLAVAGSKHELALMLGVSLQTVCSGISRSKNPNSKYPGLWLQVEVDDEEMGEEDE